MGKKKFVRRARVVEGSRWYIDYTTTNLLTGEEYRSRPDFDLHLIPNLEIRREVANRIARSIEKFIIVLEPNGVSEAPKKMPITLAQGIKIMREEKTQSRREDSNKNYKTICDRLLEWAKEHGYANKPLEDFQRPQARKFKKFLLSMGTLSNRTVNNYIGCLVTLWNSLEKSEQEIKVENPFSNTPKERVAKKKRRVYTPQERAIVVAHIEKNHYWLYRAMLLLYYCGIRRNEMCRLKFGDFDLNTGLIEVSEANAKSYKERMPTIPRVILPAFRDGVFDKFPKKNYVFGQNWEPNPDKPLNRNSISKVHRRMLDQLVQSGALDADALAGLDFYAWKDTAITRHIHITTPISTRDQVGHATLEQTLVYYHAPVVNLEYRDLPDTLHE